MTQVGIKAVSSRSLSISLNINQPTFTVENLQQLKFLQFN
jgi:hypothetical protein